MPIDTQDIERLREIFITRQECDRNMGEVNDRLSNDNKELAVINAKLSIVLWILTAVGTAVIAVLVKSFWGV